MKITNMKKLSLGPAFVFLSFLLFASYAFAGEEAGNWRATYDIIMMWVNFGILAFVIIKFGKEPVMNFLKSQKDEVAFTINEIEDEKKKVEAEIAKVKQKLADRDVYFKELKKRTIKRGELEKQKIIDEANEQTRIMMEMAAKKIEYHIISAKKKFRDELIDMAIDLAAKKLPKEITEEDNQRMVEHYIMAALPK